MDEQWMLREPSAWPGLEAEEVSPASLGAEFDSHPPHIFRKCSPQFFGTKWTEPKGPNPEPFGFRFGGYWICVGRDSSNDHIIHYTYISIYIYIYIIYILYILYIYILYIYIIYIYIYYICTHTHTYDDEGHKMKCIQYTWYGCMNMGIHGDTSRILSNVLMVKRCFFSHWDTCHLVHLDGSRQVFPGDF